MSRSFWLALLLGVGAPAVHADPLPYAITLDAARPDDKTTLSFKDVSDQTLSQFAELPPEQKSIGRFQELFEQNLIDRCSSLFPHAKAARQARFEARHALGKWLANYSLDASVESDRLSAMSELVRSMKFVSQLSTRTLIVEEASRAEFQADSQWCGKTDGTHCIAGPLFHLVAHSEDPSQGLYDSVLAHLSQVGREEATGHHFHILSYQLLWDPPLTRVRYSASFYFEDDQSVPSRPVTLLGHDLIYVHEANPEPVPYVAEQEPPSMLPSVEGPVTMKKTFGVMNFVITYPIGIVIGVKNAAFELAKMPFSFIAGFLGRGHPYQYPLRNLKSAKVALVMEIVHPQKLNLLQGISRLLGETPIIGAVFQVNDNPDRVSRSGPQKIYLTRGIYGGSRLEQDTGLWQAATHTLYPRAGVVAVPYEFGTITDVVWSMFNLSNGQAYVMADRVMETCKPGERIYMVGHSAGVQRITMTSRLLTLRGYDVRQMVGIAGPSLGQASVNMLAAQPFKLLLNPEGDIVSAVGVGAKGLATLADFGIRRPIKLLGDISLRWDRQLTRRWDRTIDRMGVSDAQTDVVITGLPAKHETPLSLSLTNRIVFDRFVREEFQDAFRDDLQPQLKKKTQAIPYRN